MNTKDFERLLISQGYSIQRQKGSHRIWGNGDRHVTVPQRPSINRMVARRLLKEIKYPHNVPEIRYAA